MTFCRVNTLRVYSQLAGLLTLLLVSTNEAVMSVYLQDLFLLGKHLEVEFLGHRVTLVLLL